MGEAISVLANRYHSVGTTMSVETKSLATQINNDQLLSGEEVELTHRLVCSAPVHRHSRGL